MEPDTTGSVFGDAISGATQFWLLRALLQELQRTGAVDTLAMREWLSLQRATPDPASGPGLEMAQRWLYDTFGPGRVKSDPN